MVILPLTTRRNPQFPCTTLLTPTPAFVCYPPLRPPAVPDTRLASTHSPPTTALLAPLLLLNCTLGEEGYRTQHAERWVKKIKCNFFSLSHSPSNAWQFRLGSCWYSQWRARPTCKKSNPLSSFFPYFRRARWLYLSTQNKQNTHIYMYHGPRKIRKK